MREFMRTKGFGFGFACGDLTSLLASDAPDAGFCAAAPAPAADAPLSCCLGFTIDTALAAAPGAVIWNVLECCFEKRTRIVRTSSWTEAIVVTSDASASWFSDMSRRMCSTSCFCLSSFLALFCTYCSRTSRILSVRWIESNCGSANSWICGGPPWPGAGRGRRKVEPRRSLLSFDRSPAAAPSATSNDTRVSVKHPISINWRTRSCNLYSMWWKFFQFQNTNA